MQFAIIDNVRNFVETLKLLIEPLIQMHMAMQLKINTMHKAYRGSLVARVRARTILEFLS